MPDKPVVLLPQPVRPAAIEYLQNFAEVVLGSPESEKTLFPLLEECQAILIRTADLPARLIERASNLKIIARHGVGVDNVDLDAATKRGIPVVNTPDANSMTVAEHVMGMMIASVKAMALGDAKLRQGQFEFRNSHMGVELYGKTLGIVGMGRIGTNVARIAKHGFSMEVLAYDPHLPEERFASFGVEPVQDLNDLLPRVDFLTLHLPLIDETRGIIGPNELDLMKKTAVLVNAARGGLVDEFALAEALSQGRLRAAALDVFDDEPPSATSPLFKAPNLLLTPHMAAHTEEAMHRMAMGAAERIIEVLQGGPPRDVVNPDYRHFTS